MKKIGFVLTAAILLAGCGQKKEATTTTARPVKTTIVESRSIISKDFSGIVEAVEYVKLAFRVNGQIIQLPVIEGQKVKRDNSSQLSTPETSRCNMPPQNRHTKRLPHKWNVTNDSSPGKLSPYRNTKSVSPTTRKRNLNTNYPPTICATRN